MVSFRLGTCLSSVCLCQRSCMWLVLAQWETLATKQSRQRHAALRWYDSVCWPVDVNLLCCGWLSENLNTVDPVHIPGVVFGEVALIRQLSSIEDSGSYLLESFCCSLVVNVCVCATGQVLLVSGAARTVICSWTHELCGVLWWCDWLSSGRRCCVQWCPLSLLQACRANQFQYETCWELQNSIKKS